MMQLGDILLIRTKRLKRFTKRLLTQVCDLSSRLKEILGELDASMTRAPTGR
jgi:hypothetical protein